MANLLRERDPLNSLCKKQKQRRFDSPEESARSGQEDVQVGRRPEQPHRSERSGRRDRTQAQKSGHRHEVGGHLRAGESTRRRHSRRHTCGVHGPWPGRDRRVVHAERGKHGRLQERSVRRSRPASRAHTGQVCASHRRQGLFAACAGRGRAQGQSDSGAQLQRRAPNHRRYLVILILFFSSNKSDFKNLF